MTASELPRPSVTRLARPSWREPRLLVGVLLVVLAIALGAKAVSSFDERVPVYAAAVALVPGDRLGPDNLTRADVRLGDRMGRYLSAATAVAPDTFVVREVREGELVPASAVGSRADVGVQPVTVRIDATAATGLVRGSVVDVWISDRDASSTTEKFLDPHLALRAATVSWLPGEQTRFGVGASTSAIQILVPRADVAQVIAAQDRQSRVTLVPVPGSTRASG